ncbi:uncharacterized protein [Primulina eburnea]|uniref:uncharacterized protein n=1 Tax=Primulina eburnea TaxID=1245227 RepID=UPI003C6CAF3C
MDFHLPGASPSSSASSSDHHHANPVSQKGHSSDPMHSWWESISKARSRIQLLSSLLPSYSDDPLSSLADTDRPARSLLFSSEAYSSVSTAISSPTSGSGDDPLCHWLYDTYLSGDPDLRLVVLSYLPLISSIYLHRMHNPTSDNLVSLSGFEAVLLALYSYETKARHGKPVTVSIPDLSQPSLYHSPRNPVKYSNSNSKSGKPLIGVLSPPLEPQIAVKSTKRACIVGVALDCYYQQISQIPSWSKVDFCKYATIWAGNDCSCTSEFDQKTECIVENNGGIENNNGFGSDITAEADEIENMAGIVKDIVIKDVTAAELGDKDTRIPVPWELLQPILRILGHCLLGPLGVDEVKDAASVAVRRFYARASHELIPQAILATRSLIQLDKRAREAATAAVANSTSSNANTPSKAKKPEILLVSK